MESSELSPCCWECFGFFYVGKKEKQTACLCDFETAAPFSSPHNGGACSQKRGEPRRADPMCSVRRSPQTKSRAALNVSDENRKNIKQQRRNFTDRPGPPPAVPHGKHLPLVHTCCFTVLMHKRSLISTGSHFPWRNHQITLLNRWNDCSRPPPASSLALPPSFMVMCGALVTNLPPSLREQTHQAEQSAAHLSKMR